jgi:hypothetical protein
MILRPPLTSSFSVMELLSHNDSTLHPCPTNTGTSWGGIVSSMNSGNMALELSACLTAKNGPSLRATKCVFPSTVTPCLIDTMQQNRRRDIRRTDALRGEIESDRLKRLLALTRGLDALRLLDKNERLLFATAFRNQMASLDSRFVPKHYPDQPSLTDHSLQRRFSDVEASLDQREFPWLDEVDLDELYYKNGVSVATDVFTPEETDVTCVGSQVASRENKHRLLDLAANTALGPKNRIFTTSNSYWNPRASINTRADMFWSRPQRWTPQKTTKRAKNGKVWHRPWLISICSTVVVWLNWT